jgi:hypothetical protein
MESRPIRNPAAAGSEAWVYGSSLGAIAASNPAGEMNDSLESVVCC